MESEGGEPPGVARSLRVPAFRSLFSASTTSTFGAAVSLVSVSWIVYHYTGDPLDISLLGLAGIVPGIVNNLRHRSDVAGVQLIQRFDMREYVIEIVREALYLCLAELQIRQAGHIPNLIFRDLHAVAFFRACL